ncbi:MAG: hypothetical protein M0Q93_04595 [Terrimicrobiaceae bacterium]|nr:hypothetical protein [Terrimicrobiaceae bacterium]
MKTLNWNAVGRFLSVVQNVYVVIRDGLSGLGIGFEILEWITGDGKESFTEEFLKPLGAKFLQECRIIEVDDNTIRVNLDAPPTLPFDGATVKTNKGGGWVEVQKRADGLYIAGRKVILHLSERQKDGKVVKGYELFDEVTGLPVLHPNILDALLEYTQLIPEEWKKDENGNTIYIFFWAVTFGNQDVYVYVRYLCFDGDRWSRNYSRLGGSFVGSSPAAVLAGN